MVNPILDQLTAFGIHIRKQHQTLGLSVLCVGITLPDGRRNAFFQSPGQFLFLIFIVYLVSCLVHQRT